MLCEKAQIRLTSARRKILACLGRHRTPVNLDTITQADELRGYCDATTVYRTLMLLKELDVVRQVSVRHNIRYFVLNVPGEACDFLICRCCGSIAELPPLQTVLDLEQQVSKAKGYAAVYHELEVYGICPKCQGAGKWNSRTTKLPVRFKLAD
jgi:Fur family ferric uptake transcriptional regulator